MKQQVKQFGLALTFLFSAFTSFQSHASESNSKSSSEQCHNCQFQWHVGLAVGQGHYESPLFDKDDIDINFIPQLDISYKNFRLKNTTLTYDLIKSGQSAFSLKSRHNFDGVYYYASDSSNDFNIGGLIGNWGDGDEDDGKHLSYLAGVEYTRISGGGDSMFSLSLLSDISNTHNGQEAEFVWTQFWLNERLKVTTDFILGYKSTELIDYYYGDSFKGDNLSTKFKLSLAYEMNKNWYFILNYAHEQVAEKVSLSVDTNTNSLQSYFAGALFRW